MRKEEKGAIIDQISETLGQYDHFYVADIAGLNAADTAALRRACFNDNVKLVVVKNTLLQKALEKQSTDYSEMFSSLVGNSAIMFSAVGNAPAKIIKKFAASSKIGKPELKAAYVEQGIYVGADKLNTLAAMKSKNEVIADIVALLQSPIRNIISGLQNREEKTEE